MNKKIVAISISFIIVLSLVSSVTFASDLQLGNQFDNHTYVGPFNISNNKTKHAKSKLASDLSELQTKLDVNLIYQDIQFTLPPETIKFDIDMTLANANSGEDNPIITTVSRDGLGTVLNQELPWIQFDEDAIDSVATGIEKELQSGIMPRNVYITDHLGVNVVTDEVVASSKYSIDVISPAISKALHTLDKTVIEPFESFSLMELVTRPEVGPLSDEEMTLLSSLLYSTVLQTNFQIDERNISAVLPSNIQPGFEARMNQTLGLDFKLSNPNKTEFTIRAAWSAGVIHLSIEGKPFYYTYEPTISNVETYKPRTIRQYSAFVKKGQVVVSEEGKEGVEAIVKRTLSVGGKVVNSEDVSEDFYAPIHRIEIHPLAKEIAAVTESKTSEEADLSQDEGSPSDKEIESSNSGEDQTNSSTTVDEQGTASSTEGEVIYDKSGLPIFGK